MPFKSIERRKQFAAEHYAANVEIYKKRNKSRRALLRAEIHRIKEERGCEDCGGKFPYYVLEFDHRNSSEKLAGVSLLLRKYSRTRVLEEIAKCDVVCANCHRRRGHERGWPRERLDNLIMRF